MARAVGGSRAVETFLRNFEGEKSRYQEILEVTLCYGVQCLARTFSLKGYDKAKGRDFYVRQVAQPGRNGEVLRTPVEVRAKPSHSWRDGEVEMSDFPEPEGPTEATTRAKDEFGTGSRAGEALYALPPPFDEIDFHTKLLGKQFVDLAWKVFAGKEGAQIATRQELEGKFVRVDQRKTTAMIPALELPVASFAEFLGAYVTENVKQAHRTGHVPDEENCGSEEGTVSKGEQESIYGRRRIVRDGRSSATGGRRRRASTPRSAIDNAKSLAHPRPDTGRKTRPLHPQPQRRQLHQVPPSLQHVQSKIQPELDAQRHKILRVKKTQSQRMAETLARARLAEYDARRELQDVCDRRLGPKKMPIRDITKGAAALEIVDDFMRSPLMDKFSRGDLPTQNDLMQSTSHPAQQHSKDTLKEELYGTAALDSSFLGCKPVPKPIANRQKQLRRNYNGWLGDFGPLHTKTVRPEWDEVEDNTADLDPRVDRAKFEWNFEHLPGGYHETVDHPKTAPGNCEEAKRYNEKRENDDFDDELSDVVSAKSDPVFRWLKDAV